MYFVTILAWFGSVWYGFVTFATISSYHEYYHTSLGNLERLKDEMKGYRKTFNYETPALKSVICISWLIFYYFS